VRRAAGIVALALALSACNGFGRTRSSPQSLVEDGTSPVRVETIAGEKVVLWNIDVRGDSLVGERTVKQDGDWVSVDPRFAIPLGEIEDLEVWHDNTVGIFVVVGMLIGGAIAIGYLVTQAIGS